MRAEARCHSDEAGLLFRSVEQAGTAGLALAEVCRFHLLGCERKLVVSSGQKEKRSDKNLKPELVRLVLQACSHGPKEQASSSE